MIRGTRRRARRLGDGRNRALYVRIRGFCNAPGVRRNEPRVQRQAHGDVEGRVDPERSAPAHAVEQPLRQRPEDRTGEAAEQRQRGHRAPIRRSGQLMQRGEGGVVQTGGHRDASQRPAHEERRVVPCEGECGQRHRTDDRAPGEHEAPAAGVDQPAYRRRHDPGEQQADRECTEEPGCRDPELAAHRVAEHGDGVEERAPRDDLRHTERGYEPRQTDRRVAFAARRHG